MTQITVFGASGKVGRLVVAELVGRGHNVVAFVHSQKLTEKDFVEDSVDGAKASENIRIVQGDIYDAGQVAAALSGSQAVISALGSWGTKRKDILCSAMRAIIPAMEQQHIQRIVSLTGHDARTEGDDIDQLHKISHVMLSLVAGTVLRDGEQHISLLRQSSLDWTVLRSPIMTGAASGQDCLTTRRPLPWATVPRQAVAKAMADQLDVSIGSEKAAKSPYVIPDIIPHIVKD